MCVDPLNFESSLRRVEKLGVDSLHIDIMDASFVPNMSMGLSTLEALSENALPIDVHLMVSDNDFFLKILEDLNIHQISVHLLRYLDRIKSETAEPRLASYSTLAPAFGIGLHN